MDLHEKDAHSKGFREIAGVDEAGRGPLAGPVVAAAVILPYPPPLDLGIKDSKALSKKARASVVMEIFRHARAVGVAMVWPEEIDRVNILRASLRAMEAAVGRLSISPGIVLVDGNARICTELPQRPVVSGDALSVSIAAASIVAKTARDSVMAAYHLVYPQYNFASHKGYPSKEHLGAMAEHGPSPIHRRSFRGVVTAPHWRPEGGP